MKWINLLGGLDDSYGQSANRTSPLLPGEGQGEGIKMRSTKTTTTSKSLVMSTLSKRRRLI
jgi:predicted aconitase with swiveling domain